MLPTLSHEQNIIVAALTAGNNVTADCVAGSGKTTTILGAAQSMANKQFLVLTYNRRLCDETRERAKTLHNIVIHTYHSACRALFNTSDFTDEGIRRAVNGEIPPKTPIKFDILVVDELQDASRLYYQFVIMVFAMQSDSSHKQLFLLGDRYQEIYTFKGADSRYLTLAGTHLYPATTRPWSRCTLQTTYRLTPAVANFVNSVLNEIRMIPAPGKERCLKVRYIVGNQFDNTTPNTLVDYIRAAIRRGLKPDNIALISNSVKKGAGVYQKMQKILSADGFPVYEPHDDEAPLLQDAISGKILICSIHQMKGLERDLIILNKFDSSYFEYYDRTPVNPGRCPNLFYVALTRARQELIVIHSCDQQSMPFVDLDTMIYDNFVNYEEIKPLEPRVPPIKHINQNEPLLHNTSVTDLLRFQPIDVLSAALKTLLGTDDVFAGRRRITAPLTLPTLAGSRQSERWQIILREMVADLNGIAIPAMYEYQLRGECSVINSVIGESVAIPATLLKRLNDACRADEEISRADFMEAVAYFSSIQSGYTARAIQLQNYNWLDEVDLEPIFNILNETVGIGGVFEEDFIVDIEEENGQEKYSLAGRYDVLVPKAQSTDEDNKSTAFDVWEIKCTESFSPEHILQCGLYMFARSLTSPGMQTGHILNLVTGEQQDITASSDQLLEMALILLREKYRRISGLTDEEFLEDAAKAQTDIRPYTPGNAITRMPTVYKPCPIDVSEADFE